MSIRKLAAGLSNSAKSVSDLEVRQLLSDSATVLTTLLAADGRLKIVGYNERVIHEPSHTNANLRIKSKLVLIEDYHGAVVAKEPGPIAGSFLVREGLVTHKDAMAAIAETSLENAQLKSRLAASTSLDKKQEKLQHKNFYPPVRKRK